MTSITTGKIPSFILPKLHSSRVYEVVAAKRTAASVAAREPAEQTVGVECVLTRRTPLVRQLHRWRHNGVADSTLRLSLECTLDIPSEDDERIYKAALEFHCSGNVPQPALPLLFADGDARAANNDREVEWVGRGHGNAYRRRGRVFVNLNTGNDLLHVERNLDLHWLLLLGPILTRCPFLYSLQCIFNYQWREL